MKLIVINKLNNNIKLLTGKLSIDYYKNNLSNNRLDKLIDMKDISFMLYTKKEKKLWFLKSKNGYEVVYNYYLLDNELLNYIEDEKEMDINSILKLIDKRENNMELLRNSLNIMLYEYKNRIRVISKYEKMIVWGDRIDSVKENVIELILEEFNGSLKSIELYDRLKRLEIRNYYEGEMCNLPVSLEVLCVDNIRRLENIPIGLREIYYNKIESIDERNIPFNVKFVKK